MTSSAYPSALDFVAAMGKPLDKSNFEIIAKAFDVPLPSLEMLDKELYCYDARFPKFGLEMTFEDEGVFLEREGHRSGTGPIILTICTFWGAQDDSEAYKGPLLSGIKFEDSLVDVKNKIGEPMKVNTKDNVFFWEYPDFRLTIQWDSLSNIRVVAYWKR